MRSVGADVWAATRTLPPGTFPFKFVMDETWSYDADLYTVADGGNINNAVVVVPVGLSEADLAARDRVLADGGRLTEREQARLKEWVKRSA